jgi:hypothetical protein
MNINMRVLFLIMLTMVPISASAAVRISEVAWMGIAGEGGQFGEWIELHNDGIEAVDLAGWKIFVDGGVQLLFSLTKSIPAGGYLLIERTTASMQDPVPGVADESGTFGGGGLSNVGEDVVLKDAAGVMQHALNHASGWPAGDATTKQTMQWNGTMWITAPATPKSSGAASQPPEDEETEEDPEEESDEESRGTVVIVSKKPPVRKPNPHIELSVPRTIIVHVPYKFNANVYTKEDDNPSDGVYRWNFGDGSTVETYNNYLPVIHQYDYAGTYTAWLGYYENIFAEDPVLSISTEIIVQEPNLLFSISGESVVIENKTSVKIDLSNWTVQTGMFIASIAKMTMLAPNATITIPQTVLRIPIQSDTTLHAPDGTLVSQPKESVSVEVQEPILESVIVSAPREEEYPIPEEIKFIQEEQPLKTNRSAKHWVLGAAAFAIVALSLLLERLMAKRE